MGLGRVYFCAPAAFDCHAIWQRAGVKEDRFISNGCFVLTAIGQKFDAAVEDAGE